MGAVYEKMKADLKLRRYSPRTEKSYLLPVKVLGRLFRGKFFDGLARLFQHGKLAAGPRCDQRTRQLLEPATFARLKDTLYKKDWVVYAKAPFKRPAALFRYLGQYTHRVALQPPPAPRRRQPGRLPHPPSWRLSDLSAGVHASLSPTRPAAWLREDPPLRAARRRQRQQQACPRPRRARSDQPARNRAIAATESRCSPGRLAQIVQTAHRDRPRRLPTVRSSRQHRAAPRKRTPRTGAAAATAMTPRSPAVCLNRSAASKAVAMDTSVRSPAAVPGSVLPCSSSTAPSAAAPGSGLCVDCLIPAADVVAPTSRPPLFVHGGPAAIPRTRGLAQHDV
jgi:hypothetical protein